MKISISNDSVSELERIYRELYKDEDPEDYDISAAIEWWKSLSPSLLKSELRSARAQLKASKR